jgi:SAM-dependent methyltransferase
MATFQIVLIKPSGFLHSEAFREVAETLQFGLRNLGHTAQIQEDGFATGATNLVLGSHLLLPEQTFQVPHGSVIYNLEQLGGPNLQPCYYELALRHQIWDYSLQNIQRWQAMNPASPPIHVPLGYVPELTRITSAPNQDIDVLFYGSLNDRRRRVVKALQDAGVKVHSVFGVYGTERDNLIARSKIILNVHFYDAKVFEIVRVSYLFANSKAVVTEVSSDMEAYGASGTSAPALSLAYNSLVDGCLSLLRDDNERQKLENQAFQWFSSQKESAILRQALTTCIAPATTMTEQTEIPRKMNMGSGKDWRVDYFNVDIDAYWEPDAVLDFNHPLPIGQSLVTQRFGNFALQENFFDEIMANDCLEHIPKLTTAMTSCLKLLKPGGKFDIRVPYDLSWGAWQDPTHVRAFNERSWLYYTDWFWYMGWTEARFDLVQFEVVLSPVGQALKEQLKGEALIRHPRAIDQLRVVLRKRLLSDAEKNYVTAYLKRPNRQPVQTKVVSPVQPQLASV